MALDSDAGYRMKPLTQRRREALRESFRPEHIRLLFIGEAPPASGRFFYSRNSGLYRAMRDAFRAVETRIDEENFLTIFQESGCFLIDLCPNPVDRLSPVWRRHARVKGERPLSKALVRLQPEKIAPLLRSIIPNVREAASRAGWHGEVVALPYPGRWSRHRATFMEAVRPTLLDLLSSSRAGTINTLASNHSDRADSPGSGTFPIRNR